MPADGTLVDPRGHLPDRGGAAVDQRPPPGIPRRRAREDPRRPGARLAGRAAMSIWGRDDASDHDHWRNPHRLYRDTENGRIAGVCAGISDYFGVRRSLVRLAAILGLVFFFVPTFIA